ncbi:SPOR domain-containing protein [Yanghanlia caeni]|uniref:SPOR domain-containing protein n=1 Tax=Yanghanlia caeni TaxID=3064283 RepID=A0ABU1D6R4_9BURK|nr:SPOR domain-containing protein [Alcaligenaceae bacterium LG-2]NGR06786.1 SPOR domain-containing protein [bacterium SGD-2]HZH56010.1 SPOR domain-containing protein [Burkholderiaceae bacterium]
MATRRKPAKTKSITLYGIVVGLILGLAAAVAVALFVTQVPMPFADKASRKPPSVLLPDVRDAPDPNQGLHGRTLGAVPGTGITPPAAPLPGTSAEPAPQDTDNLGNLIASLGQGAPPSVESQVSTPSQVATPAAPPANVPAPSQASAQGTYYLQAGAFRGTNDAEAMKARVIMLGLPAQVQAAQVNGTTLHRVRVGPFKGLDEMNTARSRLGAEKIETSVVRQ